MKKAGEDLDTLTGLTPTHRRLPENHHLGAGPRYGNYWVYVNKVSVMRTVILDFETFYSKEFSLRRMTPVEYALDPRFQTILVAVHEPGVRTSVIDGEHFADWLKGARLHECAVVSHNALFDMSVLAWRYGVVPKLMVDTLGVSRALLGHRLRSLSLANVALHLGIGVKGDAVHNVIGMNRDAIKASGLWESYASYSCNDAALCWGIYDRLVRSGEFPIKELSVMDMVLRCAIQPKFRLDDYALAEHLAQVKADKAALLSKATALAGDKSVLMSNDKFAELLRQHGVEPPTKTSPTTGKETYAFAKTDKAFIALEEHPDPAVQTLVAARAGFKSTIEETRTERLLSISQLTWPGNQQKLMPIPLRYSGAHTHRLSGDWKLNMQNLPRGGKLRRALIATPDHQIVTVDASQIEARITAWICGQDDLVHAFAIGEDIYCSFGGEIVGFPINKKDHPLERFLGKTSILGLGFQVGAAKFANTIEVQSQLMFGQKIPMPLEEAMRIVTLYRTKYSKISSAWRTLHTQGIQALAGWSNHDFRFGPCVFERNSVLLPSGLRLHYHNLKQVTGEFGTRWEFEYGGEQKNIYGGKLLENIVQALARIITMNAALRIQKHMGLGMQVHDELVYSVPRDAVPDFKKLIVGEMRRRPEWAPDLPLDAEAGEGDSYGEAK